MVGDDSSSKKKVKLLRNGEHQDDTKKNSKGVDVKKSPVNKKKPKPWDEDLRAALGSAEKDTTHISHKLTEKEKKVRRRPKKIIYEETPESEDEENPVELDPEAQKILDTLANNLLRKIEESRERNVLQPASQGSGGSGLFGAVDCVDDKVHTDVVPSSETQDKPEAEGEAETELGLLFAFPPNLYTQLFFSQKRCSSDELTLFKD